MLVTFQDGRISLDHHELPGEYQGCRVQGQLETDKRHVPGQKGSSHQPKGFSDWEISVRVKLCADAGGLSPYGQLKTIGDLFQGTDAKAKPQVWNFVHPATRALGIRKVLFVDLAIDDKESSDVLDVDLKFVSYTPIVSHAKRRARKNLVLWADHLLGKGDSVARRIEALRDDLEDAVSSSASRPTALAHLSEAERVQIAKEEERKRSGGLIQDIKEFPDQTVSAGKGINRMITGLTDGAFKSGAVGGGLAKSKGGSDKSIKRDAPEYPYHDTDKP